MRDITCPHCGKFIHAELELRLRQMLKSLPEAKRNIVGEVETLMNDNASILDLLDLATVLVGVTTENCVTGFWKWRQRESHKGNVNFLCWLIREEARVSKCQRPVRLPVMRELKKHS